MLNLSDKDLDRLSQEAAQQYEPQDVGPKLWEKLETRLDRDLGKVNPNPAHGIRRLPFYYAPAVLVILAVGYYFVRTNHMHAKGGPPGNPPFGLVTEKPADQPTATNLSSKTTTSDKQNSSSSLPSNTFRYAGASDAASSHPLTTRGPNVTASHSIAAPAGSDAAGHGATGEASGSRTRAGVPATTAGASNAGRHGTHRNNATGISNASPGSDVGSTPSGAETGTDATGTAATGNATIKSATGNHAAGESAVREPTYSPVGGIVPLTHGAYIDDSALRAFNLASIRQPIPRRGGLHINRSLIFGLHGAADFASVNSVDGGKAGSTFGLTVDYQFASHLYVGSGLLFSRKVFAALPENYHVPPNFYSNMNMGPGSHVQFITGRFTMLEVPLDLRYDFVSGDRSIFFAAAGTSSYFFTSESCGYYYQFYNRTVLKNESYHGIPDNLFSTLNLSMGVELGISNSFSALFAPYVKIPTRNLGVGQVQMTSFGLDFALRFAPVISRKR